MKMMQSRTRFGRALMVAAALLPTAEACYVYTPPDTGAVPPGQLVELDISDMGRVGLGERFGSGLAAVQGRLVQSSSNEYVVNVYRVSQLNGASAMWSGEMVRLDRSYIGTVKQREFSASRTALLVGSAVAGVAVIALGAHFIGHFGGYPDPDPGTGVTPASLRVPVFHP
jgi:hypothetical protein